MTLSPIPLFFAAGAQGSLDLTQPMARVLASNWYIMGQEVAAFEKEFAAYCGVAHCLSLANGSDALEIALRALDVGPGDKVLAIANAGFYSSIAIHLLGATPVYVEIDAATQTMDPADVQAKIAGAKVVIVTHLYGQLAAIEEIMAIAGKAGVAVIEDCAQSHGAMRNGKRAGSFAPLSCFSYYPTKNLGALGDGGAICTSDPALAQKVKQLRQYGWSTKYTVDLPRGRNSRLDEMQAAILREKLPHLDFWNAGRRMVAAHYNEAFEGLPLQCPASVGEDFVAHLYVVRVKDRDAFRAHLKEAGVTTDIHYPIPDHQQPAYLADNKGVSLPVTEQAAAEIVSLPCFTGITEAEIGRVIAAVKSFFKA
jgi:dTDP-4-amino-4,6-dideoxygalactose transaminase